MFVTFSSELVIGIQACMANASRYAVIIGCSASDINALRGMNFEEGSTNS